jgi:hypothetical protein
MKVSELVAKLQAMRQDAPVLLSAPDGLWSVFDIEYVVYGAAYDNGSILDRVIIAVPDYPEPDSADPIVRHQP